MVVITISGVTLIIRATFLHLLTLEAVLVAIAEVIQHIFLMFLCVILMSKCSNTVHDVDDDNYDDNHVMIMMMIMMMMRMNIIMIWVWCCWLLWWWGMMLRYDDDNSVHDDDEDDDDDDLP